MLPINIIPVMGDNYTYLFSCGTDVVVVDPGESSEVLRILTKKNINLTKIVNTHHHFDHVGGNAELKDTYGCSVIGGDERIPGLTQFVEDGDVVTIGDYALTVLATPGHTAGSVCYILSSNNFSEPECIFTGDTLFVGGCGRPFELQPDVLYRSLQSICSLSTRVHIYCGHEYTIENYEFAVLMENNNTSLHQQFNSAQKKRRDGKPTVPSTIEMELLTNPFLRVGEQQIKSALGLLSATDQEVFAALRQRKNIF